MGLKKITPKEGEVYFVDAKTGEKVEPKTKQSSMGLIFIILAVIIIVISFYAIIGGVGTLSSSGPAVLIAGILGFISGLLFMALGNILDLLQSISRNTSKANKLLEDLLKNKQKSEG